MVRPVEPQARCVLAESAQLVRVPAVLNVGNVVVAGAETAAVTSPKVGGQPNQGTAEGYFPHIRPVPALLRILKPV